MAPHNNVIGAASFAVLLDDTVDGMFVLDRDYRIIAVYGGCERIIGCSQSELLGSCCRAWAEGPPSSADERPWLRMLSPERDLSELRTASVSRLSQWQSADGSEAWVETTHAPMYDSVGEIACILGVLRDITDDEARRASLTRAADEALLAAESAADAAQSGSDDDAGQEEEEEPSDSTLDGILQVVERREILAALRRARGQRAQAARELGISRSRLYRRMEALGIDPREDP